MTVRLIEAVAAGVWAASWHAAVVAALVLVVRQIAGRRLPPAWRTALWGLVAIRLVLVVAPQATWSAFGILERWRSEPAAPIAPAPVTPVAGPTITVGYGPVSLPATPVGVDRSARVASVRYPRALPVVWLLGVGLLLVRTGVGRRALNRRLAKGTLVEDPRMLALLDECRRAMGVARPVGLVVTDAVAGPALAGVRRPRILLTPGLCDRLDREQLRFVFLHELAHARRHDVLIEGLIAVLTAVHWFNPAVWLAARLYRADRELSRDEMVLRRTDRAQRQRYGDTLLCLLESFGQGQHATAVAMLGGKRSLTQRIGMIANLRPTPARLTVLLLAVGFGVVATLVLTNPKRVASTTSRSASGPATEMAAPAADAILKAQLERRMTQIDFAGQRLEDAMDFLRDVSGASIYVDWRALEAAGVRKDSPVTARLASMPLAKVLNHVLSDAGGDKVRLTYLARDGVITISTAEELMEMVTTAYDVHDLVIPVPDFDSDKAAAPAPTTAERSASLAKLVRETIDPTSWTRPRRPASLREVDGVFVITQEAENHRGVAQLLEQLRESRGLQILTATRFIVLDPESLPKDDPSFAPILALGRDPAAPAQAAGARDQRRTNPTCLTAAQAAALLDVIAQHEGATRAAPVLTTFNGQRAYVKAVTSRAYVADLKVTRDAGGKAKAYEPVVEAAESGLTLDLQGTVSADRRYVTLGIRSQLSKLVAMRPGAASNLPADRPAGVEPPAVQVPEIYRSETRTTVSVPDGQTLVLGGGPDAGLLAPEGYEPKPGQRLYILVTPRIVRAEAVRPPATATPP